MKKIVIYVLALLVICAIVIQAYKIMSEKRTETVATQNSKSISVKKETVRETENIPNNVDTENNVETNKVWEFSFYKEINVNSITSSNVYVLDENYQRVSVQVGLSPDRKSILIYPPAGGYKEGESYQINFKKGLTYTDGENVDGQYLQSFSTDRKEVEEAKLSPKLKVVKDEDIIEASDNQVSVSKRYDKSVKVGDILVLKTNQEPTGVAVKVVKKQEKNEAYNLTVEEPNFFELYEQININKTYEFTKENFKPASGVSIEEVAALEPHTQISALMGLVEDETKYEFKNSILDKEEKVGAEFKKSGIELRINSINIGKAKVKLSGRIKLLKPEVDVDIDSRFLNVKKAEFVTTSKVEADLNIRKGKKVDEAQEIKDFNKMVQQIGGKKEKGDFSFNLGKGEFPIGTTGISIEGEMKFVAKVTASGDFKYTVKYENITKNGIVYKKKKTPDIVYKNKGNLTSQLDGLGKANVELGPEMGFKIKAYHIVGLGAGGSLKADLDGKIAAGYSTREKTKFLCGNIKSKLVTGGNVLFSIEGIRKDTEFKKEFLKTVVYKSNKDVGKCEKSKGIKANTLQVQLKANTNKSVKVKEEYFDFSNFTTDFKTFNPKNLEIKFDQTGIAQFKKNKNSIVVTAKKEPEAKSTVMVLEVKKGDLKGKIISIPIVITDYEEIQKQKEKEKAEKEAGTENKTNWEGEWTRPQKFEWSVMTISNVKGNTFKFNINATFVQSVEQALNGGVKVTEIDGTAKINGNVALQVKDGEGGPNCQLKFVRNGNNISIDGTVNCQTGPSAGYDGDYKKGHIPPPDFSDENIGIEDGSSEGERDTTQEDGIQEEAPNQAQENTSGENVLTPEQAEQLVREYLKLPADSNLTVADQGGINEEGDYIIKVYEYSQEENQEKFYGMYSVGSRTGEVIDVNNDAY